MRAPKQVGGHCTSSLHPHDKCIHRSCPENPPTSDSRAHIVVVHHPLELRALTKTSTMIRTPVVVERFAGNLGDLK